MSASKVTGGLNPTVDTDKDIAELTEPRNHRNADVLDAMLTSQLKQPPGMYIINKLFYETSAESMRSSFDITYDRFYPAIDLLVHNFSQRRTYQNPIDGAYLVDVAKYRDFAEKHGMQFLPIIDGELQPDDLGRISIPARGANIVQKMNKGIPRGTDAA